MKNEMSESFNDDLMLEKQVQKLYYLTLYARWILVGIGWLTIIPWGLWQFRETFSLCQQYCTWAAVRMGIEFNLVASFAMTFIIAFTTSNLVWQSYHILKGGLSEKEKYHLAKQVKKIRQQGNKNILWHWLKNP